jgi:phosphoribosylpyrophosphate synthetase
MKLLAGNANQPLASSIADYLDVPLTRAQVRRFADNEIFATIDENVRGEDVFIIQSTSAPANDHLMELLICMDALRRASARRITAVLPGPRRYNAGTPGPCVRRRTSRNQASARVVRNGGLAACAH